MLPLYFLTIAKPMSRAYLHGLYQLHPALLFLCFVDLA